jgi:hypothetical protein
MVVVAWHENPDHILCRSHGVHRLTDDGWGRRHLIKCVAREQDMAGAGFACQTRKRRQAFCPCLPQPNPYIFGKAAKGFAQMQVGGVQELDQMTYFLR